MKKESIVYRALYMPRRIVLAAKLINFTRRLIGVKERLDTILYIEVYNVYVELKLLPFSNDHLSKLKR